MTNHLQASPPERYEEISRHLLEQAQEELDKGDILQASDKVWGATAHAVKAVCQRMGWNHHAHNHLRAAANYVFAEFGRDDLTLAFGYLEALHANYYEHQWEASDIRIGITNAMLVIRELSAAPLYNLPSDRSHLSPWEASDIRIGITNAMLVIRELSAAPLYNLPSDRSHLSPLERQGQERRLRLLTRKNQYSHGPQFSAEEVAALPPVAPPPAGGEDKIL